MYCKSCGKQLSDEAFMCPECGAPTKPMVPAPVEQKSETHQGNYLGVIGFFLSTFAFVTGIILGSLMLASSLATAVLLLVVGSITILPGLAGISVCIPAFKNETGTQKILALIGMVLGGIVLLFVFIAICIVCGGASPSVAM